MAKETLNIYQRINAVQRKVKYVQKDAQINGGGSYKAVSHDNVVSVLREEMVKAGIISYPDQLKAKRSKEQTANGKPYFLYTGRYAIHFVNADNPEDRLIVTIEADGADNADKAPGKAVTYATKAAMLKVFNLETGENEESRRASSDPYSEAQKEMFDDIIDEGNALAYAELMFTLPHEAQAALQNSGERGKKIELKDKCKKLGQEAHKIFDDYANQFAEAKAAADADGARELIAELTDFEKKMVAARFSDDTVDWLKEIQDAA